MNAITHVPGTARSSTRANPAGHENGSETDFQMALGVAAATQTRAPHDMRASEPPPREEQRQSAPRSEDRVAAHGEGERSSENTGASMSDGAGRAARPASAPGDADVAQNAAPASPATPVASPATPVASAAQESLAAAAAQANATNGAPQAAGAPVSASTPVTEGSLTLAAASALQELAAPLPAPSPSQGGASAGDAATLGAMSTATASAEQAAADAGGFARVVAQRLATPVPVAPATSRRRAPAAAPATVPSPALNAQAETSGRASMRGLATIMAGATAGSPASQPQAVPMTNVSPANPVLPGTAAPEAVTPVQADAPRAASASPVVQAAANRIGPPAAMDAAGESVTLTAPAALARGAATAASEVAVSLTPVRSEPAAAAPSAPAPRLESPVAPAPAAAAVSAAGGGAADRTAQQKQDGTSKHGGDHSRPEAAAAATNTPATPASAPSPVDNSGSANAANTVTRLESPVVTAPVNEAAAPAAVRDPRLEPMRRVADQVTLQFQGEDGMEGRLRISVRGDSVRASILSSHDGTLQRAGSELNSLKRALADQGFTDAKLSVHDTRTTAAAGSSSAKDQTQTGEERRQGEPQRKSSQGRETRQDSGQPRQGRRGSQGERRDA